MFAADLGISSCLQLPACVSLLLSQALLGRYNSRILGGRQVSVLGVLKLLRQSFKLVSMQLDKRLQ